MIPKRIKMGGWMITVEQVPGLRDHAEQVGSSLQADRRIGVEPSTHPADTIVHELIHFASYFLGVDIPEGWVLRTEAFLVMLIKDNPSAIRWIVDEIAGIVPPPKKKKKR